MYCAVQSSYHRYYTLTSAAQLWRCNRKLTEIDQQIHRLITTIDEHNINDTHSEQHRLLVQIRYTLHHVAPNMLAELSEENINTILQCYQYVSTHHFQHTVYTDHDNEQLMNDMNLFIETGIFWNLIDDHYNTSSSQRNLLYLYLVDASIQSHSYHAFQASYERRQYEVLESVDYSNSTIQYVAILGYWKDMNLISTQLMNSSHQLMVMYCYVSYVISLIILLVV